MHALSLGSKTDTVYIYNDITLYHISNYVFYQMHVETFWRPMNLQDKMDYLHLEGQIEGIRLPTILPNECKNICNKVTKIVSV